MSASYCLHTNPVPPHRVCTMPWGHPGDHAVITSKYGDGPSGVCLASWRNFAHPEAKTEVTT